ncbi:MAG: glycerol-3-phosphate dehydrogenase/oxidase [Candidatus Sumerlaeaceae bacterium]|nr:glycerol-3-phosphate dehydrogenase/oxidase [Candidatus Sumerlaeaceae bacterium]
MKRDEMIGRLKAHAGTPWDFIIIGGGATGVGIAIDAASRGYKPLLLEQCDFAKGTSSRSTKLAHGGVRYLQQGNISLVLEALRERGLLRQNAPHLVHDLAFIVPNYDWWEGGFYGFGLRVYDLMAGKLGFGPSRNLSVEKTIEAVPTLETKGLRGGVVYYDGQFDDARLVVNMVETAVEQGATMINYMPVTGLIKKDGFVRGVTARDEETGETYTLDAKVVINATGPFTDNIRRMEDAAAKPMISPSQGVHIVLEKSFLPGDSAIMVPHTDDGRVLFAIPWHDCVVVGTTDTPVDDTPLEPRAQAEELEFLLKHAARYLTKDPTPADVLSVFVGIRPLAKVAEEHGSTASLSRDHTLHISNEGLVTIAGGKWTTYRRMAEDTVNQALLLAQLDHRPCVTVDLRIHGYHHHPEEFGDLQYYGSDAVAIGDLIRSNAKYGELLHPARKYRVGEVVWAVRNEMARTVEDFLSRRTRALLLGAKVSVEMAPTVARIMAEELGRDEVWQQEQVRQFTELAKIYTAE